MDYPTVKSQSKSEFKFNVGDKVCLRQNVPEKVRSFETYFSRGMGKFKGTSKIFEIRERYVVKVGGYFYNKYCLRSEHQDHFYEFAEEWLCLYQENIYKNLEKENVLIDKGRTRMVFGGKCYKLECCENFFSKEQIEELVPISNHVTFIQDGNMVTCIITYPSIGKISSGIANCSSADQFSYLSGKTLSYLRAMDNKELEQQYLIYL